MGDGQMVAGQGGSSPLKEVPESHGAARRLHPPPGDHREDGPAVPGSGAAAQEPAQGRGRVPGRLATGGCCTVYAPGRRALALLPRFAPGRRRPLFRARGRRPPPAARLSSCDAAARAAPRHVVRPAYYQRSRSVSNDELFDCRTSCPVCGSKEPRRLVHVVQEEPRVELLRCPRCHACSTDRMPTDACLERYYQAYYEDFDDKRTFHDVARLGAHIWRSIDLSRTSGDLAHPRLRWGRRVAGQVDGRAAARGASGRAGGDRAGRPAGRAAGPGRSLDVPPGAQPRRGRRHLRSGPCQRDHRAHPALAADPRGALHQDRSRRLVLRSHAVRRAFLPALEEGRPDLPRPRARHGRPLLERRAEDLRAHRRRRRAFASVAGRHQLPPVGPPAPSPRTSSSCRPASRARSSARRRAIFCGPSSADGRWS